MDYNFYVRLNQLLKRRNSLFRILKNLDPTSDDWFELNKALEEIDNELDWMYEIDKNNRERI
jgi:hypothetical protein